MEDDADSVLCSEGGIRHLDLGCGGGTPSRLLATAYPASEFHGIDRSEEALAIGRAKLDKEGLSDR